MDPVSTHSTMNDPPPATQSLPVDPLVTSAILLEVPAAGKVEPIAYTLIRGRSKSGPVPNTAEPPPVSSERAERNPALSTSAYCFALNADQSEADRAPRTDPEAVGRLKT